MEDRLTPGAAAGAAGAIVQILYGFIIKGLNISSYAFTDFGEVLIMGKPFPGTMAFIVGTVCHIVLGTTFGIVLSYIIKYTTKRFYLLKGLGVGIFAWVFANGSGTFFKMPTFTELPPQSAVVILIGATIYGLTAALTLKMITDNFSRFFTDEKIKENKKYLVRYRLSPAPARKIKDKDGSILLKKPLKFK